MKIIPFLGSLIIFTIVPSGVKSQIIQSVPLMSVMYSAADTSWRESAKERIDQYRKADFQINVFNKKGKTIPGADQDQ